LVSTSTGARAAGLHHHQVALDAARVEVVVQADHHEHVVDVRGDQLQLVVLAGGAALEQRAPRQQFEDVLARRVERHPVADDRAQLRVDLARPRRRRLHAPQRSGPAPSATSKPLRCWPVTRATADPAPPG
jgi:hypothetical protein